MHTAVHSLVAVLVGRRRRRRSGGRIATNVPIIFCTLYHIGIDLKRCNARRCRRTKTIGRTLNALANVIRSLLIIQTNQYAPTTTTTTTPPSSLADALPQGSTMTVLGAGKSIPESAPRSEWGSTLPDTLQSVEVGKIDVQHCIAQLDLLHAEHEDSMICSATLSSLDDSSNDFDKEELGTACHGDSGGPLIVRRPVLTSSSSTTTSEALSVTHTGSSTEATADATPVQEEQEEDVLLGVVSVGKQSCNGEATAYTKISYASAWMCDIMCGSGSSMGLMTFEDCPDWCHPSANDEHVVHRQYDGTEEEDGGGDDAVDVPDVRVPDPPAVTTTSTEVPADATGRAQDVDTSDVVETINGGDAADTGDPVDVVNAVNEVEPPDAVHAVDAADSIVVDAVEPTHTVNTADPADAEIDAVEPPETANTISPVDTSTVNAVDPPNAILDPVRPSKTVAAAVSGIDCDKEGDLEYIHKPNKNRKKPCRWLGNASRSESRVLRICSKTNASDVCSGTCRGGSDRCVYISK
mmetsp:Transcript_18214/g.40454  ORF Transcript_18214/g.40454 Transcript_18214/m.40454 type:complete len:523 (-) Transcript_18214:1719-3287(-)